VHEFPEDPPVNPYLVDISIDIDIDMQISSDTIFQTYASMLAGDYDVRYIVDIYNADESRTDGLGSRVQRIVKTESNIISNGIYHIKDTVKLTIKKYRLIAWMDFVEKGSVTDKYYNTDDLQRISILPQSGGYQGYNTTKDAFTAKTNMDLTPYSGQRFIQYQAVLSVKRPFAIYQIITTDIKEYITYHQTLSYASIQPSSTTLAYNLFFPLGYNAYLNAPDNLQGGVRYSYDIVEIIPEQEAVIASDFVFVEDNAFLLVDFEVFSAENAHINTIYGLRINLERNKLTIIRAEFLTKDMDDGHVGIEDGFDDDEIIVNI
jgi:hypothetical protein